MSKIRTTKPDFWSSEQIVQCSTTARLLFIGLWNFCDDNGIHPASHTRLKMEVFPGDNFTTNDIKTWIDELLKANLLITYQVNDKEYWQVTGWHHQKIDRKYFKYPPPPNQQSNSVETSFEQCANNMQAVPEQLGKGTEGKGNNICQVANATQHVFVSQDVEEVFQYWQQVMGHTKSKFDKKRSDRITKALLDYSLNDLKQAIDGCKGSQFHMGNNPTKTIHDGIGVIFRDSEQIEKFIALSSKSKQKPAMRMALDH